MEQNLRVIPTLLLWLLDDFLRKRPDCSPFEKHSDCFYVTDKRKGYNYWQITVRNQLPAGIALLPRKPTADELWTPREGPLFSCELGKPIQVKYSDVQDVHAELDKLLKGMLERFPFMYIQLQPYTRASKMQ